MAYVLDSFNSGMRQVLLKDDWNSSDYKMFTVRDWSGYESDIDVQIDGTIAIVTLSSGAVFHYDLTTPGNIANEI